MKFPSARQSWLLLSFVSAGLVMASILLTVWLKLNPCHLCIFQRLLFMLLAVACGVAAWRPQGQLLGLPVAIMALIGTDVAAYQSWLQVQTTGSISCVGGEPGLIERLVEWLGERLPELFLATGYCEDVELVIFGLSLANWALVTFVGFLALSIVTMRRSAFATQPH